MNDVELAHPTSTQLAAFGLGQLTEGELAKIEGHLAHCIACREAAESVADDTLIALLRSAATEPASIERRDVTEPQTGQQPTATALDATAIAPQAGVPTALTDHPRYRVGELLGVGGMGAVYKAEHLLMQRPVALKLINRELVDRPATSERFRREVRAAGRLTHPNIVTAFDAEQAGDWHFLAMEYVDGVSLARRIAEHGPLSVPEACDYVRQAALGLQHAHECGMVHRDIKPHNLMLTPTGQVKILDFGLARFALESAPAGSFFAAADDLLVDASPSKSTDPVTQTGMVMGTPDYIAPEQARDSHTADIRADIYSLGCTLYDLLAGKAPFSEGTPVQKVKAHMEQTPKALSDIRRDVPPELMRVIERMMAKDAAQRFQTPADVVEALTPFLAKTPQPPRRKKWLATAGAVAALILVGAVIYIQTDHGEFVIDTDNDKVAVMVNNQGVKIRDLSGNREYDLKIGRHRLRPGEYRIEVQELPAGVEFSTDSFTLKRGGKTVVAVTFNSKKDQGYLKDEALRWFPADAIFYCVGNMEAFPGVSQVHRLIWMETDDLAKYWTIQKGDRFRMFVDLVGRIDRVAIAYTVDRQDPDQSRYFNRFTGSIKHNRLVDFFRQEWPGATIEQSESKGVPITVIYDSQPGGNLGTGVALIGTTDLILAGYGGRAKKHVEVVRESLDLREGRGVRLPVAHAKDLEAIPASAWVFGIGETPEFLKKQMPVYLRLARSLSMSISGTNDIEVRFRGSFATETDAKLFMTYLSLLKQLFMNAPGVINDRNLSAAVNKAFSNLRLDSDVDRVTVQLQIPSVAFTALVEKIQDMPIRVYLDPIKEK